MAGESGTLSSSSITVNVGESGQITFNGYLYGVESADTNIATVKVDGESSGIITITGVSAGNTTAAVHWAGRSSTITITVINNEDTSFLNKRGLAYFWDKINTKKQNKLTAGSNITINGDTISASQPAVNNGKLTIQKNGSSIGTFTANQSSNTTANIIVPTKTSDLTNDSDFIEDASYVHTDNNYTTVEKNKLAGIAAGAEVNVQSDWATSDAASDSYIKNKPTIGNGKITIKKNGTKLTVFTANQTADVEANIIVPTTVAELSDASTYVTQNNLATQLANKQDALTAGDHIDITDNTIKAVDYIHSDDPVPSSQVTQSVTNDMIANGTITADKFATGATLKLILSTSDIGEGSPLASNTLYGVYK